MDVILELKFPDETGITCGKCMLSFARGERYHCAASGRRPICPEDGKRKDCPLQTVEK